MDTGLGFLDGVTMRISERHNPPVPSLPPRYWLPESLFKEQIDFSLEKKVLEVVEKRQKELDEEKENYTERTRLRLEEKEKEQLEKEEDQKDDPENAEEEKSETKEEEPSAEADVVPSDGATSSSSVLFPATPVLFPSVTSSGSVVMPPSTSSGAPSNMLSPVPVEKKVTGNSQPLKPINIADFEDDTYSPFDTVELKSINDIEVLASVLQNTAVNNANSGFRQHCDNAPVNHYGSAIQNGPVNRYGSATRNGPMNRYGYPSSGTSYPGSSQSSSTNTESPASQYGSYVTKPNNPPYYPLANYSYPRYATTTSYNPSMMYSSTVPSSYSTYTAPVYSGMNYNAASGLPPRNSSIEEQSSAAVSETSNTTTESFNFYTRYFNTSLKSGKTSDDSEESTEGTMKSSKSVPDLVQELEKELDKRKAAQTPPPRPTGESLEDWQPWPELPANHSPVRKPSIPPPMERKLSLTALLPDPYSKLTPKRQDLVRQITEMGFSKPRVSRLCQQHKGDEKTIIESLLLIQSLEEAAGIQGDAAEKAYQFFKEDEKKAAEFLQLLKQFMDLGFEEKRVTDAFKKCGNDKNKILDALIA